MKVDFPKNTQKIAKKIMIFHVSCAAFWTKMMQVKAKLVPSWTKLAPIWCKLGSSGLKLGPNFAQVGPIGDQFGPSWCQLGPQNPPQIRPRAIQILIFFIFWIDFSSDLVPTAPQLGSMKPSRNGAKLVQNRCKAGC